MDGRADRQERVTQLEQQMQAASAALEFERAGRIKAQLDQVPLFEDARVGPLRSVADFNYVVLQPGRRKGCVRAFVVTPGRIHFAGEMQKRDRAAQLAYLAALSNALFAADAQAPDEDEQSLATPEMKLIGWHLHAGREEGVFVHAGEAAVNADQLDEAVEQVLALRERKAQGQADVQGEAQSASTVADEAS